MSRSYKKAPFISNESKAKYEKRLANKKVRKYKYKIPNGKKYKNIFLSWDICTNKHFEHLSERIKYQEIINNEVLNGFRNCIFYENENSDDFYMQWYKRYKMK